MKKILIALLFVVSPMMTSAQVVPATYADVESITQRIHDLTIQILTMQIAELQEQIRVMLAAQTDTISTKIDGIATGGAPSFIAPIPAPVATLTFGPQWCLRGQPIVPINLTNVDYSTYIISTGSQRYAFEAGQHSIDWLDAGTYDYSITAWSGRTQPFTEGTWQDTRKVSFAQNGTVVVDSCN